MHGTEAPSEWVRRWSHLIEPGSVALDVACGAGRHLRWLHGLGHRVVGVDRSAEALDACEGLGEMLLADIEHGPWPLAGRTFGAVVVTNYLWRPLLPTLVGSVAPGGVLIYETFAQGNETVGRPARPEFLLAPGELIAACAGLRVVAYEHGFQQNPDRFVQRITAVRELPGAAAPSRHLLRVSPS
ncbi:class I SAM-dependent methyltransferase [Acidovorax sp.]|uniref:class I SAM-dependent methyltransferase n=1 Tax=Acidovorax sp. TaxID=1872122 RepID=UPI00391B89DF